LKRSLRKGIILAGGTGSRLAPLTSTINKQLFLVYDKPMIYYPLSTLMLCGIKDILIITNPNSLGLYKKLLGNGNNWGINIKYEIQKQPQGIAQSVLIGEKFIGKSPVVIVLGDNLFYGNDLIDILKRADSRMKGGSIFAYSVREPERYGVVQFDKSGAVISIEEKPSNPKSEYAVTGLYFYDNSVVQYAKDLEMSSRGEFEITSINKKYFKEKLLKVEIMGRGITWFDTGTFESLYDAASYIRTLENRQGLKIGCPEEVAFRNGWISNEKLKKLADSLINSNYGKYLLDLSEKYEILLKS